MADDMSLAIRVALDNSNFQQGLQNMNRQIRAATAEFKNATAGLGDHGKGLDSLKAKSDMLSKQIDAQSKIVEMNRDKLKESRETLENNAKAQVELKEKIETTKKAYEDSIKTTGENSKETKALKEELDKLSGKYADNEEKIRNNTRTLENYEIKVNNAEAKLKNMESQLRKTNDEIDKQSSSWYKLSEKLEPVGKKMEEIGDKISGVGKSLSLKLTAPLAGVGAAATKLGVSFEKSMSEVAAVSGATEEELKQLEKSARDAGATTDKSARDAADALKYMALAGWDVETSQKALMPVLKMSSAAGVELGRTSDLVTDSMSSLGLTVDELNRYLDVVALTQSNANTSAEGMMEAYVKAGGTFKNMNVSMEESAAMLGILANRGLKGAEAGNSLNSVMVNLSGSTDKTREIFKELGIEIYDQQGNYIGLESTLEKLNEKFAGMTESEKNYYMAQLVGKTQIDTMTKLLDGLGDEYYNLKEGIEDADGALEKMYETSTSNTMGAINNLKSALEELGLKIFDNLQPTIERFVEIVQSLTDWFNNLSPSAQENIVKFGALAAIIGPVMLILGKLVTVIGEGIGAFAGIAGAISEAGGIIAALSNPVTIAVAAIAGLVAAVIYLWKTNEDFRDAMQEIWEKVKGIIETTLEIIKAIIEVFVEQVKTFWEIFGDDIKAITETVWQVITTVIDAALQVIQGLIDVFAGLLTGDWERMAEGLKTIWSGMWQGIKTIVEGAWDLLKSAFDLLWKAISEWFVGLAEDAFNWGADIVKGLWEGIKSLADWIGEKMKWFAGKVAGPFKRFFGIESPSKLMAEYGENLMEGLAIGMEDNLDIVEEATNRARDILDETMTDLTIQPIVNVPETILKRNTLNTLNKGKQAHEDYAEFLNKLNADEVDKSKKLLDEEYQARVKNIDKQIDALKAGDKKKNKARIDSLRKEKQALKENHNETLNLINERSQAIEKAARKDANIFQDKINQFDVAIKRLTISTGDLEQDLINQNAVIILQQQKVKELEKRYNKLAKEFGSTSDEAIKMKKALEDARTELIKMGNDVENTTEKIKQSQIDAINDFTNRIKSALKQRYEDEYKMQEKAIRDELDALDKWKNDSIDRINSVYDTRIRRIEETAQAQIKALQAEIDALDQAEKQKSREEEDSERVRRINRLKEALKYEHDEFNKAEIQKELNKELKAREEQLRQWQIEDRKEQLRQEIQDIQEHAARQKEVLQRQKEYEISRINDIYEHEQVVLNDRMTAIREFYEQKTQDAMLQAEAEKMIMDNNQKEIIELLHSYEEPYRQAGQSLGEKLVEGFRPAVEEIMSMIDDIYRSIDRARSEALESMAEIDSMSMRGMTTSITDNRSTVNKNIVSITSPKALNHAEINRQTENTLRRMALA